MLYDLQQLLQLAHILLAKSKGGQLWGSPRSACRILSISIFHFAVRDVFCCICLGVVDAWKGYTLQYGRPAALESLPVLRITREDKVALHHGTFHVHASDMQMHYLCMHQCHANALGHQQACMHLDDAQQDM